MARPKTTQAARPVSPVEELAERIFITLVTSHQFGRRTTDHLAQQAFDAAAEFHEFSKRRQPAQPSPSNNNHTPVNQEQP